jgi:hypothetical protein
LIIDPSVTGHAGSAMRPLRDGAPRQDASRGDHTFFNVQVDSRTRIDDAQMNVGQLSENVQVIVSA